jgi:hypothetical protein
MSWRHRRSSRIALLICTLLVKRGGWLKPCSQPFIPRNETQYPFYRSLNFRMGMENLAPHRGSNPGLYVLSALSFFKIHCCLIILPLKCRVSFMLICRTQYKGCWHVTCVLILQAFLVIFSIVAYGTVTFCATHSLFQCIASCHMWIQQSCG